MLAYYSGVETHEVYKPALFFAAMLYTNQSSGVHVLVGYGGAGC